MVPETIFPPDLETSGANRFLSSHGTMKNLIGTPLLFTNTPFFFIFITPFLSISPQYVC
eukprot:m.35230 g.35230  ORF g.35230 m.35230 type:complete len:59 (+) comp6592_c1_seq2:734-910(+)